MSDTPKPAKLDPYVIGCIVTAVVGTVILVVALTIMILQKTDNFGSIDDFSGGGSAGGSSSSTRTNYLVATLVQGLRTAPANIVGPISTFLGNLNYTPGFNSILWMTGNQNITLSPSWMSGSSFTSTTANTLTQFTLPLQVSATAMDIGVVGVVFNSDTSLPIDSDIPTGFSSVFTVAVGSNTQVLTLPVTLPGTFSDYIVFAQNGDAAANPVRFSCGVVISATQIRLGYSSGFAGLARCNFIVVKKRATSSTTSNIVYSDTKTISTPVVGNNVVAISLTGTVSTTANTVWFAYTQSTAAIQNVTYGIQQATSSSVQVLVNAVEPSTTVSIIAMKGVPNTQFSY